MAAPASPDNVDDGGGADREEDGVVAAHVGRLAAATAALVGGATTLPLTADLAESLAALGTQRRDRDSRPAVEDFLRAVAECRTLVTLHMEPVLGVGGPADNARAEEALALYGRLGAALEGLPGLHHVYVVQRRSAGTLRALATVLDHLRDVRFLTWCLDWPEPEKEEVDDDDDDAVLQRALAEKSSIECLTFELPDCEADPDDSVPVGHLLGAFASLPALKQLHLNAVLDAHTAPLAVPLLRLPSLQLGMKFQSRLGREEALAVCAAIAQSNIQELALEDCDSLVTEYPLGEPGPPAVPVALALRAPRLRTLRLDSLRLRSRAAATRFAQALAAARLERVEFSCVRWHDSLSEAVAGAVFHPGLKYFSLYLSRFSDDSINGPDFVAAIGRCLKHCRFLETLHISMDEPLESLREFVNECSHRFRLTSLWLPPCDHWTRELDASLALVVLVNPNLSQLRIRFPRGYDSCATFSAPALLDTCRGHPAIESVHHDGRDDELWCPRYLEAMDRVLRRNQAGRLYPGRVAALLAGAPRRGLVAPALAAGRGSPSLLYHGVTSFQAYLL